MRSDCVPIQGEIIASAMDNEPWQKRARRAGLTQAELSQLAGVRQTSVSDALRGKTKDGTVPVYLQTIIRLWEIADRKGREAILADPRGGERDA